MVRGRCQAIAKCLIKKFAWQNHYTFKTVQLLSILSTAPQNASLMGAAILITSLDETLLWGYIPPMKYI